MQKRFASLLNLEYIRCDHFLQFIFLSNEFLVEFAPKIKLWHIGQWQITFDHTSRLNTPTSYCLQLKKKIKNWRTKI